MAIIIRTLFNNQDWAAPCTNTYKDRRCHLCFNPNVRIKPPKIGDDKCSGDCWERYIGINFRWGCTPKGKIFGTRAKTEIKVFLVYKQVTERGEISSWKLYTLWGIGEVTSVDDSILLNGRVGEMGYSFIHFKSLKIISLAKRVHNLTAYQLVSKKWGRQAFRYIDSQKEAYLMGLL